MSDSERVSDSRRLPGGRPSRARAWLFLAAAIVLEVAGSLSLKGALEAPALYAAVAVGYAGAFSALGFVLRAGMPLGAAYGIWGASGVALTAIMSMVLFGEPLSFLMGAGICLIIAGVVCVELGAGAGHRKAAAQIGGYGPGTPGTPTAGTVTS